MFKTKINLLLLTFLFLSFFNTLQAQLSKKHFIPPLTYAETGNANPNDQYFYISTPKTENVNFNIKKVGSTNDITGVVSRNNPQIISLENGEGQLFVDSRQTSVVHSDKGYIIEADDVIYVSVRMNAGGDIGSTSGPQAGALVSKGAAALGTTFRAGMYTNQAGRTVNNSGTTSENLLSFISVMATENNTTINFANISNNTEITNNNKSFPFDIILNEGESYIIAMNSFSTTFPENNKDGLIGALITSNNIEKPIVVNVGSSNGSFHNGGGRDYGIDQIVDVAKVGSEYIFVRGRGNNEWEKILIVAHKDDTKIFINGNTAAITTIDAGEYYTIDGSNYGANNNMYVQTSEDVFAYQGIGGLAANGNPSEANQGMFFVPPLSCENRKAIINIPNIDKIGTLPFDGGITIVTNKTAEIKVNSNILNIADSKAVTGNLEYVTYEILGLKDDVIIESTDELYCAYFNYNGSASSGSFYSGFPSNPEINFDTSVSAIGNCIGNGLKLKAANEEIFDDFEWFIDNGTGFKTTNIKTTEIVPTEPGKYQLRTKIICDGTIISEWSSTAIPVSICPDDYDNDTIIDNIDDDLDNDGILNCNESIGNATLNLSIINNPEIIFQDNSTNSAIVSAIFTTTDPPGANNVFLGQKSGIFETIVNPETATSDSKIKYELKFTQNINFKLTQNKTISHIVSEGEFFILKIGPYNKNVTLLDPDDQLLVDTNLDGEFETGVTNISASEIHFKYAANTTGANSTFQFIANQVNQIAFKHHHTGTTTTSEFGGDIQLTCFTRDSDNDGIEDMFDLDSDNDGIPDLNETDNDTDGDSIPNYLDLDSDNDGIYDSTESGHNLDNNLDGIIDAFVDTNNNGIADALENDTSVQTLSLNYPITDTDTDAIFNFLELDADNDACFDVIEAGFTGNGSGMLAPNPLDVNNSGVVNNSDGYIAFNNFDYLTDGTITVTNFTDVTFCEEDSNTISINTNADTYQWQSFDGTNWIDITDNILYNGATTKDLTITKTPLSLNNQKYRVQLDKTGNSCGAFSNEITLIVNPKPVILNTIVQLLQCADNASEITTVNLTEAEINISKDPTVIFEYYETEAKAISGGTANQVADKEKYPVNRTASAWVRTVSDKDCYTISRINITASYAGNITYDKTFEECDDFFDADGNNTTNNSDTDGITFFDFSAAEQEVINTFDPAIRSNIQVLFYETIDDRIASINEIPDISNHRNNKENTYTFNQTIYIKIKNKNNNDCEGIGKLLLKTSVIPEFSVEGEAPSEPIIICAKNIPYALEALAPSDNYDYIWTDTNGNPVGANSETLFVSDAGSYTVTAYSRNTKICSRARTIVVQKSNFETIDDSFVTITDDSTGINSNLSIQIDIPKNPVINEEFQYALEDENGNIIRSYQDSNIFNDIEGGIYKILVENKNGCGSSELIVSVLQLPKFFTPNGDGNNDLWEIKGASKSFYQPTSSINIFNRFGKLVARIEIDGLGWNGTYKGKKLPADDYWYSIQLIPTDASKTPILKKGNFSLLNK